MPGQAIPVKPGRTGITEDMYYWALAAAAAAVAVYFGVSGDTVTSTPGVLSTIGILFSFYHCFRRYGIRDFQVFFAIVFVTASVFENIGVLTGFPFGAYHYSDKLGTMLLLVPVSINIAYFQMLYICWNLSEAFLGSHSNRLSGALFYIKPAVAAFLMVMWNLCFDPFMSTLHEYWIWEEGGAYFGVPLTNFAGWYLCVFVMLLLFSLYTRFAGRKFPWQENFTHRKKSNWIQLVLIYTAWPLFFLLLGFTTSAAETACSRDGHIWFVRDMMQTSGLIGLFTVVFAGFIVLVKMLAPKGSRSE